MNPSFDRGPQGYRAAPARIWPDHTGADAPDAVYSIAADRRVGEVLTAWSNQTREGFVPRPKKQAVTLFFVILFLAGMSTLCAGLALDWLLGDVLELSFDNWLPYVVMGVSSGCGAWLLTRPRAACTYVGTEGIAQHNAGILRRTDDVLHFVHATSLNIAETNRYTNGVYQGTDFRFTWNDASGKAIFKGAGTRFIQGMWKDLEIPAWSFLCAAEVQWNQHRWAAIEAGFSQHQRAVFGNLVVREGRLDIDGESLGPSDLESITFQQGYMHVRQHGAKKGIFGTKGISTRSVASIPDFPLFLRALRRWGGFEV